PPGNDDIQEALELLENPEQAGKLAAQLRAILNAKKIANQLESGSQSPVVLPGNLFLTYKQLREKIQTFLNDAKEDLSKIPVSYEDLRLFVNVSENRINLINFALRASLALIATLIIWFLFRGASRILLKKQDSNNLGRAQGFRTITAKAALMILPWVALFVFASAFFSITNIDAKTKSFLIWEAGALSICFGIMRLLSLPTSLPDHVHSFIKVWTRRVMLFSLWVYVFIIPSVIFNRATISAFFTLIHRIGISLFLGIILAQWKKEIGDRFSVSIMEHDPNWKSSLKKVWNYAAKRLYLVFAFYLGVVLILPVLGLTNTYRYLLLATLKSLGIALLAVVAWLVWNTMFGKLVRISDSWQTKNSGLEGLLRRYVNFAGKAGKWGIALATTLAILDIWGLHAYALLTSNSGIVRITVRVPLIVILGIVGFESAKLLIIRLEKEIALRMLYDRKTPAIEAEKRATTLGRIFQKIVGGTILTIATMMIFAEFGLDLKPILASAGIVGLAVGFGAQNLVRDIISGMFLTIENRIRVGDVAVINGTGGLVEELNLRTTILRGNDGTVHVFPNGAINTLSNMTHEFSYYVFDIGVAYKEDTDRVVEALRNIGEEALLDKELSSFILEPFEILGVDQFSDSAVIIKARIKTLPIKQWTVGREMNRRIKKRFDELGIDIPFPHRTIYFANAGESINKSLSQRGDSSNI
ncbi:MAG: mechanosensitive ion channel domain-containing protein, partial [Pseudomonadota bacterium]